MRDDSAIDEGAEAWLRKAAFFFHYDRSRRAGWSPLTVDDLFSVGYEIMVTLAKTHTEDSNVSLQVFCSRAVRRAFNQAWHRNGRALPSGAPQDIRSTLRIPGSPLDSDEQHTERVRELGELAMISYFTSQATITANDGEPPLLARRLRRSIEQLPDGQRSAMQLLLSGNTQQEIASRLGTSRGSARRLLTTATKNLAQRMTGGGDDES